MNLPWVSILSFNKLERDSGEDLLKLEHSESGAAVHDSQSPSNFSLFNYAFTIKPGC